MEKAGSGLKIIRTVHDLIVYKKAKTAATEVFELSKRFPKSEIYSLTDQVLRSSRSVAINIREGYAKRKYAQVFLRHLNDALGSSEETRGWLEFAFECNYISQQMFEEKDRSYLELGAMIYSLMQRWKNF